MSTSAGTQPAPVSPDPEKAAGKRFRGKRAAMVTFSGYPGDPRPRRAAEAYLSEGWAVDLICLADGSPERREVSGTLTVYRIPLEHTRGGKLRYAFDYSAFLILAGLRLLAGLTRGRYHLVHVHNMPDVLVFSALAPKLLGAKVILDQHDPMPELMKTIFGLSETSFGVLIIKALERISLGFADAVITVNLACKRIFSGRGCDPDKITIVMNAPDEKIFPLNPADESKSVKSGRKLIFMYHGSLVERNGLDLAVRAIGRLNEQERSQTELRVYGKHSPFLQRVMAEAEGLGVAASISYRGHRRVEDLPTEIRECDIGVIPNQKNAFTDINTPTRIFEYLAMGKPVIAPRATGITDYFENGSLLFFELGSEEDLAHMIIYACSHPAEILEVARRGQEVYRKHCWQEERAKLLELVEHLVPTDGGRLVRHDGSTDIAP